MEQIYIAIGTLRDFDGGIKTKVIGARRDKDKAAHIGHLWVVQENEANKSLGLKVHASYNLIRTPLI